MDTSCVVIHTCVTRSLFINEVVTEQTLFITCELKRIVKRIVLQNIVN